MPRGMQSFRRPMQSLRRDPSIPDMFDQVGVRQRGSQAHTNNSQHRDGTAAGERRSPPEDLSDTQRRQRPRRESAYSASAGRGSRPGNFLPALPITNPDTHQRHNSVTTTTSQQQSPVRQPFSPTNPHTQPQHNQVNDFWARRAQTLHTSQQQQQPPYQRAPNFPHQPQGPALGSANLASLAFMQQAAPFSNYVPPINTSANNGSQPRLRDYPPYPSSNGTNNLQPPMSAELPPGTAYPGPPPSHSPAFYQQLPQLAQFQSASYPPSNGAPELGRHGLGLTGPNNYYAPT